MMAMTTDHSIITFPRQNASQACQFLSCPSHFQNRISPLSFVFEEEGYEVIVLAVQSAKRCLFYTLTREMLSSKKHAGRQGKCASKAMTSKPSLL